MVPLQLEGDKMKTFLCALAALTVSSVAYGETPDPWQRLAAKKFAECVAVETSRSTTTTPVAGEAMGECDTGGGGVKSCTLGVGATQPDYVLDTTINKTGPYYCQRLDGDNPCAFVQPGPIVFTSERSASRSFTTNSDRVALVQTIPQLKLQATFQDFPQPPRTLYTDAKFSVAIKKTMFSARLECTLQTGDQVIYPIDGNKDLSDKIKFVSENTDDPALNIFTYQVLH